MITPVFRGDHFLYLPQTLNPGGFAAEDRKTMKYLFFYFT